MREDLVFRMKHQRTPPPFSPSQVSAGRDLGAGDGGDGAGAGMRDGASSSPLLCAVRGYDGEESAPATDVAGPVHVERELDDLDGEVELDPPSGRLEPGGSVPVTLKVTARRVAANLDVILPVLVALPVVGETGHGSRAALSTPTEARRPTSAGAAMVEATRVRVSAAAV